VTSAELQPRLNASLRRNLDANGSLEYVLTWKTWDMLSGPPICALRARARPTFDNASGGSQTGWPTLAARDGEHCSGQAKRTGGRKSNLTDTVMLAGAVMTAGWPTPTVGDSRNSRNATAGRSEGSNHHAGTTLSDAVQLAGWPTPMAGSPGTETYNPAGNTDSSRKTVALVGWPTARQTDGEKNVRSLEGSLREIERKGGPQDLCQAAQFTGWATPTTRDYRSESATDEFNEKRWGHSRGKPLSAEASLVSGPTTTASTAPMERRGALAPAFSLWLMGYPPAWESCAERATRSSPKSRRNSSRHSLIVDGDRAKIVAHDNVREQETDMARAKQEIGATIGMVGAQMQEGFDHLVTAAIEPVNTTRALEAVARKAFDAGLRIPTMTFEGALACVLKEGARLERTAAQAKAPAKRGPKSRADIVPGQVAPRARNGAGEAGPIGSGGVDQADAQEPVGQLG